MMGRATFESILVNIGHIRKIGRESQNEVIVKLSVIQKKGRQTIRGLCAILISPENAGNLLRP